MEVRVLSCQLQGFVPHETVHTKVRCEVELDEVGLSLGVEQFVSVHTESTIWSAWFSAQDSDALPLHHLRFD